jgi:adenosylcobinamide kinase/adenosylcobinamide-phosphate guanylyltransferase
MTANRFILVGGGVRSGKSAFALERARTLGARRVFLATAQAFDGEMRDRITAHRAERGSDFQTLEEPLHVPEALAELHDVDVLVLDCVTLWLSNLLLAETPAHEILEKVDALGELLAKRPFHAIAVTNEVGMGIVPETPLGRAFRDLSGMAHQRLARRADEIHVAILGVILRIRPAPVQLQDRANDVVIG